MRSMFIRFADRLITTVCQRNRDGILENILWLIAERIFRTIGGVFLILLLSRYLNPSEFGIYSYVLAFTTLFRGISDLGLESIVVQELVIQTDKDSQILGSAFLIRLGSSLAILFFSFVSFSLSDSESVPVMLCTVGVANVIRSFQIIEFWFQARRCSKQIAIAKTLAFASFICTTVVLVYSGAREVPFAFTFLTEALVLSGCLILFYRKHSSSTVEEWMPSKTTAAILLSKSWPIAFTAVMVVIYMRTDQIMIGMMLDDRSLGFYSLAIRITEAFLFLPVIISNVFFPVIVDSKRKNTSQYIISVKNLYALVTWLSLSIIVCLVSFRYEIVFFLSGKSYQPAIPVLAISSWVLLFASQGTARGPWLVSEGLQKYSCIYVGIGSVANVLLNFILIPLYGIKGAAIATVVAQATVALVAPFFFKETRPSVYMLLGSFFPLSFRRICAK